MKENDKIIDVDTSGLFAEHFSVAGNKHIFMATMYLYSKQIKPTPMAIYEVITDDKAKESIADLGGLEYITLLEESFIDPDSLQIFIEKVKQGYTRRAMYNISENIKDFVLSNKSETLNPQEIINFAEEKINNLSIQTETDEELYKMGTDTEQVLKERAENPEQVPGLEVGMPRYDTLTNGAQAGDLIIVVAESKVGKSVLLTNWAKKIAIDDQLPIVYFDTEMSEREQEDRLLANMSGIPIREIVSGMYVMDTENGTAEEKVKKLKAVREELNMGHYYHVYLPQFSIEQVASLTRKFQVQLGIKAMFFDYIKIPSSQGSFQSVQEYQALGFLASGLKDVAGMLRIPVFTASQTNRNNLGEGNKDASNIGGSYRILQLASKLMFLDNKSDEQIAKEGHDAGNIQLSIKYQRNGASDCTPINIFFDKEIVKMVEI